MGLFFFRRLLPVVLICHESATQPSTPLPIRDVSGEENQECNTSDDAAFVFDANLVSTSVFGPYGAFNKAPEPPL
ncbi:hypothetical protein E4T38_07334 [Aureobasidium subglaciale]|nr:hypothetical protein E4T38_07334 [Aureobasidium subglaciale]KAI5217671.1 hypothetical protein E4T40_07345 [Aureobasidium subglaciale]KAI5221232.1 hypothetical protein E4T41_07186 [Aureobasidium subglaciale]KAI5258927.1 hypothetical protein E4T46_07163 [Aureobasidium subglaciale]